MLNQYRGGVLVIKQYALVTGYKRNGGYVKIYVAKPLSNDYQAGLVNDKGKVDVDRMVDITSIIARELGLSITREGKMWFPGIGVTRAEYIYQETQKVTRNNFINKYVSVDARNRVL